VCLFCEGETLCYSVGKNISCECPFSEEKCLMIQKCEETCASGSCGSGTCVCSPGFSGRHCDMIQCGNQTCDNRTVCKIVGGTSSCYCPTGYMGEFCDQGKYKSVVLLGHRS
jgi:hypothetical protein